jgi:hypothetical protein
VTDQEREFRRTEAAYRRACQALWQASGTANATWEARTHVEVAARRYSEAADAYRKATRAYLSGHPTDTASH